MRETVFVAIIDDRQSSDGNFSPLAALRYSERARDLARFVDDPVDAAIAEVVAIASTLDDVRRTALRSVLSADDFYELITFSKRRAVAALRSGVLPMALEAIWALTLVDRTKIDFRDLSVDFPLFAVGELDGDLSKVIRLAESASEPGTASRFAATAERSRTLTAKECGLLPIRSHYGLGFMDRWAAEYQPNTKVAELAVRLGFGSVPGHSIADRVSPGPLAPVNAPHLVALVRAGARFERGMLVERDVPVAA
jgi:hypothetical protein